MGIIPEERLKWLSNWFEVIGDIAILSVPPELDEYNKSIVGLSSYSTGISLPCSTR